ncbi:MAG TPA: CoA transferase [Alphaproteobacteria bacterium]|nr:CoA transferase [Alphaproteobacteria bacterium]
MDEETAAAASVGPLADLRVVEMGQLLAGPFCGQLYGDFGAEVIKIEQPKVGDPMRQWGREKPHGKSLWWPVVARNKKSVTLDVRQPEGQQIVRDLVQRSDILIENFRPGTMEKWGLSYEALAEINPKLIMIRVSGYGQTGPRSREAGFGSIGEAMGGLRYVIGEPDRPPARAGISIGDSLAAVFAALGGLMALHASKRTGRGQVVDSAIYEAVLAMMESLITEYDKADYIRERTGAVLPNVAPANAYTCRDGMVLIAANQDSVFRRFAAAMGRPELSDDARYSSHGARGANQVELDALIDDWTRNLTVDQVITLMNEAAVPVGRIYRAPEMLDDAHFKAREAIIRIPHKIFGALAMQNVAPKLSVTPGQVRFAGPELGEHNEEVYKGLLGFDDAKIAELGRRGIV